VFVEGMLALTFADKADYDKIQEHDLLSVIGLPDFAPGRNLTVLGENHTHIQETGFHCRVLATGAFSVIFFSHDNGEYAPAD